MTLCAFTSANITDTVISANDSYNLNVTVDLSGERLSISPLIYGINDANYLDDVTVNAVRQGGNRYTGYNWETNFSNAGNDYLHLSDTHNFDRYGEELSAKPGAAPLYLSKDAEKNGVDYKVATIQMAGYVAADADGEVLETEAAPSSRWKEVKAVKGSEFSFTPDTTDDYVYMDEYVNYLVNTLGDSTTDTGIQAYNLDNEPGLWAETHPRLHPEPPTCDEIISKNIEYASAVKSIDPNAEIFGLTLYGYETYLSFNDAADWKSTYSLQYDWFLSCYLDKMAQAEKETGSRLIDVVDLHYYSDAKSDTGCGITSCKDNSHTSCIEARLQATRSLYDETYMETSWISQWYSDYLPVLPTIRESIDTYYPGTKHAISEYNFGGGDHISGAITQADALGIFASNNVYMAALWPLTANIEYQLSAIDLYTNYDGYGSSFGDTLVKSETSDTEKATCYAAIHGDDESKVNLVLTNKSMTETQSSVISLNSDFSYKSAAVYGITGDSSDIKLMKVVNDISDNTFTVELPALSVVQIEISAEDFILKGDVNNSGSRITERADISDIQTTAFQKYLLELKTKKIYLAELTEEKICRLQGFTDDSRPTLAGVILFSDYPQAFYPQLCITAVSVPGTEMSMTGNVGEQFIDNQRIDGTLPQMINGAMQFVRNNIKTKTIIDSATGKRRDRTEYPIVAVRELILNALIHRDYSIHTDSAPITIRRFSDRLEIENPGGLYGRMTIDQLGKMSADTRNPFIANAMEIMNETENRYSGIPTVLAAMEEYGLPAPVFSSERGIFKVVLYNGENSNTTTVTDPDEKLILDFCKQPRSRSEIEQLFAGKMTIAYVMTKYIHPLIESGAMRLTIPDKPKSKKQRYVAADK